MREWLSTTNHTPEFACRSQLKWERTIIGYVNYTWTRWRNPTNNVNQCWAIKNKKNECYSYGDGCLMFMIGLLRCNFTYVCPVRSPMYCVCVCVWWVLSNYVKPFDFDQIHWNGIRPEWYSGPKTLNSTIKRDFPLLTRWNYCISCIAKWHIIQYKWFE